MKTTVNGREWTISAADKVLAMADAEARKGNRQLAAEIARRAARLYRRAGLGLMASRAYQRARQIAGRANGGNAS